MIKKITFNFFCFIVHLKCILRRLSASLASSDGSPLGIYCIHFYFYKIKGPGILDFPRSAQSRAQSCSHIYYLVDEFDTAKVLIYTLPDVKEPYRVVSTFFCLNKSPSVCVVSANTKIGLHMDVRGTSDDKNC